MSEIKKKKLKYIKQLTIKELMGYIGKFAHDDMEIQISEIHNTNKVYPVGLLGIVKGKLELSFDKTDFFIYEESKKEKDYYGDRNSNSLIT